MTPDVAGLSLSLCLCLSVFVRGRLEGRQAGREGWSLGKVSLCVVLQPPEVFIFIIIIFPILIFVSL